MTFDLWPVSQGHVCRKWRSVVSKQNTRAVTECLRFRNICKGVLCHIDDFHIVRDLDWPCQRSEVFGFLQFLGHFATLISNLTSIWRYYMFLWVVHGHGVIKGQPRSMTSDDLTWPFWIFCVFKSVSDAEFEFSTYESL